MRLWPFTVALLLAALPSVAETVEVRSGEHADFSRLVVQFEGQPAWDFGRDGDTYVLQVARDDVEFQTDDVFERMPKTRILTVGSDSQSTLRIGVGDNVFADVFELRAGRVVIDIKDGNAPEFSQFEAQIDLTDQAMEAETDVGGREEPVSPVTPEATTIDDNSAIADARNEDGEDLLFAEGGDLFAPQREALQIGDLTTFGRIGVSPSAPQAPAEPLDAIDLIQAEEREVQPQQDTEEFIADLERALIESIGRATADGLLEPSLAIVDEAVEVSRAGDEMENETQMASDEFEIEETEPRSHISIESATQRAQNSGQNARSAFATDGEQCISSARIDVAYWGNALEDGLDLAELRADLVDELDAPVESAHLRLAKYYIYLTFGAEALALLEDVSPKTPLYAVYRNLAEVMEFGAVREPGGLARQVSCDTHSALWAVMSRNHLSKGDDINLSAIMQTFNGLPPHLRLHIGPGLAKRLIEHGDIDAARQVESIVGRGAELPAVEQHAIDAKIAEAENRPDLEAELLERITLEHAMTHPDALIRFVDLAINEGRMISADVSGIAEVVAFEYLDHTLEPDLVRAAFLAKLYGEDASNAAQYLEASVEKGKLTVQTRSELETLLLSQIIEKGSDGAFLKAVFPLIGTPSLTDLSPERLKQGAMRLRELGFDEDAARLQSQPTMADDEVTKAPTAETVAALDALVSIDPRSRVPSAEDLSLADLDTLLSDVGSNRETLMNLLDD